MVQFRYAQIERAIAAAHGLPNDLETMKTFRGRVRNFQKIGLVPSAPGKGQKVSYAYGDAMVWAVCFELSELGLSPSAIKMAIEQVKGSIPQFFTTVFVGTNDADIRKNRDVFLMIEGNLLQWSFKSDGSPFRAKLEFLDRILKEGIPERALLLNLSLMKERMSQAFANQISGVGMGEPGTIEPFSAF